MSRLERIIVATLALMGAGAIVGAIVGAVTLSLVLVFSPGEPAPISTGIFIGGLLGGFLGAPTAPLLTWVLLRRVPLGLTFAGCSIGTSIGAIIAWMIAAPAVAPPAGLAGAFLGCIAAALLLRDRTPRTTTGAARVDSRGRPIFALLRDT
jgi:hypothetical protein